MSALHRSYVTITAFVIFGTAVLGALSPTIGMIASIALLTAVAVFSVVRYSGTPARPMQQVLYEMDVHEPRARGQRP